MQVIISGAGLVGLTTAIAFRRIGHSVKIFEKSSFAVENGAAIAISPDATKILESLGVDVQACGAVPWQALNVVNASTLKDSMPEIPVHSKARFGANVYSVHRADLHSKLRDDALSSDGLGPPVELHLSHRVVEYDTEAGSITLEDGSIYSADLVIAADGVHSKAATIINGFDCSAKGSENIVFRFMISTKTILADPLTAPLLERGSGHFITFLVPGDGRFLAQWDCRNSELQNYGMYVPRPMIEGQADHLRGWTANRETLREAMEGFHPSLLRLCELTQDILPLWRVTERAPVSKNHKGKLVMVGDAYHAMRPTLGQGFVNGVQDAGVLQVLFKDIASGDADAVQERLALFEKIRIARVAAVQLYSSKRTTENPAEAMKDEVRKWIPHGDLPSNQQELNMWVMSYNAMEDARGALAAARA